MLFVLCWIPLKTEVCSVGSKSLVPCGGPDVWGSGKAALWGKQAWASPQGYSWSWDTGIMEGGSSLHILLCES